MSERRTQSRSLEAKSFRKKFSNVSLFWAAGAGEKHYGIGAELIDDLAASPARGAGNSVVIGYRDRPNLNLWS
jgi:hypothetical protein